ncbi:hypothetical protein C8R47DRAFT_1068033 [Mycena vitilis]|nr:hypothetical protein C8R47DRAFT_1084585 [Mycena vitilis]KAJ6501039.1 hypothetical protein C8R47DRAFT_1068033 [Mycena vitilis]
MLSHFERIRIVGRSVVFEPIPGVPQPTLFAGAYHWKIIRNLGSFLNPLFIPCSLPGYGNMDPFKVMSGRVKKEHRHINASNPTQPLPCGPTQTLHCSQCFLHGAIKISLTSVDKGREPHAVASSAYRLTRRARTLLCARKIPKRTLRVSAVHCFSSADGACSWVSIATSQTCSASWNAEKREKLSNMEAGTLCGGEGVKSESKLGILDGSSLCEHKKQEQKGLPRH